MKTSRTLLPLGLLLASIAIVAMNPFSAPRGIAEQNDSVVDTNVRYARAMSDLAAHELQQAMAENSTVAGTNANVLVERLKNNALIAKERLQLALMGKAQSIHQVHLREMGGNLKIAELALDNVLRLNERAPGLISADEVTRLRMTVEVARLAFERARDPAAIESHDAHVQWQLDHLRHEVLSLHTRMAELESSARR